MCRIPNFPPTQVLSVERSELSGRASVVVAVVVVAAIIAVVAVVVVAAIVDLGFFSLLQIFHPICFNHHLSH